MLGSDIPVQGSMTVEANNHLDKMASNCIDVARFPLSIESSTNASYFIWISQEVCERGPVDRKVKPAFERKADNSSSHY